MCSFSVISQTWIRGERKCCDECAVVGATGCYTSKSQHSGGTMQHAWRALKVRSQERQRKARKSTSRNCRKHLRWYLGLLRLLWRDIHTVTSSTGACPSPLLCDASRPKLCRTRLCSIHRSRGRCCFLGPYGDERRVTFVSQ